MVAATAAAGPGVLSLLVSDNGAGQDGGWRQRGLEATASAGRDLGGAGRGVPRAVGDRVGPADRVPGLGRQGPALPPHRDRALALGEPAPEWDGPLGAHVKNDFARHERALGRRAAAPAGRRRPGRVRRGDRAPGWPSSTGCTRGGMGRRRLEPRRRGALRGLHGGAGLRQLGARAGRPARPGPPGWQREPRLGALARPRAGRHALRRRQEGGVRRRHRRSASTSSGPGDDARAFTIAVEGGRAREVGRRGGARR